MKVFSRITRSAEGTSWTIVGDLPGGWLDILITKTSTHRAMRKSDYDHVMCYPCMIPVFKLEDFMAPVDAQ